GWAPTLAQAACAKALNTAAVNGAKVNEQVRERAEKYAQADFAVSQAGGAVGGGGGADSAVTSLSGGLRIGKTSASSGDAGVALYSSSAQLATIQASAKANDAKKEYYQQIARAPTTQPEQRKAAQAQLDRFAENEAILVKAQDAIVAKMDDKNFVQGFGSN